MAHSFDPQVLREYALIADGERGALIGPHGDIAWMCFPQWHDPAVAATLMGGDGTYAVTPAGRHVWGGSYERDSLIWRSRWIIGDAVVECREALAFPGARDHVVVLRRIVGIRGSARMEVTLDLRADYGRASASELVEGDERGWRGRVGDSYLAWRTPTAAEPSNDGGLSLTVDIAAGQHRDLVLVLSTSADPEVPDADQAWEATESAWRERRQDLAPTLAPRDAGHACAVLQGLSSSSGGMVAASTASLPERADDGTSYDYRYVWIRDQCYAGQAGHRSGALTLLDDVTHFVGERLLADGTHLAPAYTVNGDPVPEQGQLGLPGYPGGTDTIGNQVRSQFQLDGFGEALLVFAASAERDRLDADGWRATELAVQGIEERWHERGAGVWELDQQHWTHSRLICVAGLRAVCRARPETAHAAHWLALADRILAETAAHGTHPSGRWQRSFEDERIDASLLLAGIRGAVPSDDPRTVATLQSVARDLSSEGYAYRFRPDERPLGTTEGSFLLCGFFMAIAHHQQGHRVEAARWFERNRAACGPPGLLSEEYDVEQRQLRGNLPQAFVHAMLLESSAALAK